MDHVSRARGDSVGVIGGGSWGTALAVLLGASDRPVWLWVRDAARAESMRYLRCNQTYLPEVPLPGTVKVISGAAECTSSAFLFWAIPAQNLRELASTWRNTVRIEPDTVHVCCSKGIELGTGNRMSQVLAAIFPNNPIAVLSGPNHAEEIARGVPAASVLGCRDSVVAERVQKLLARWNFRVYTSADVAGIELGGALKNIFALAAGISDGLGLGDNSKAALVTRSLTEMVRVGTALGGRRETFYGLSGIGDLMATCFSRHSRNRHVGERLGCGESLDRIVHSMRMVAEGVSTARSIRQTVAERSLTAPIINEVHGILYESQSAAQGMRRLLGRDLRPEQDDG